MAKRKRGNGEGSVSFIRSKGLWRVTVPIPQPDGTTKRSKPEYAKSKAQANEKLRALTIKAPTLKTGGLPVNVKVIIDRFIDEVRTRLEATTHDSYATVAKWHILPRFGTLLASRLTPEHLREMLKAMEDAGISASKRCHALTVVRQAFSKAIEDGYATLNPAIGVKRPKIEQGELAVLTPEQVGKFLAFAKKAPHPAILIAAFGSGLRQGELAALRWDDVNLDTGLVVVQRKVVEVRNRFIVGTPKTRAGRRTITLPQFVIDALREHRESLRVKAEKNKSLAGCPLVFPSRNGTALRRSGLGRMVKSVLKSAELPENFRFHDQRHTSATMLLAAGENPKVVQERLGHSKISTTLEIYAHVLPGMQERAAERLDTILSIKAKDEQRAGTGQAAAG